MIDVTRVSEKFALRMKSPLVFISRVLLLSQITYYLMGLPVTL